MSEEIWKPVKDHPSYEVSNLGNVRKNLKQNCDLEGYMRVTVDSKHLRVHQIEMEAFAEKNHPEDVVNHINGIKTDNRLSNLEYCTPRENSLLAGKNGQLRNGKVNQKIIAIKVLDGTKLYFNSQADASRELGINDSEINKCLNGHRNTCHGYKFYYLAKYLKEPDKIFELSNGQLAFM